MVWDIQTIKYLNSNTDKGKTVQDILNNTKAQTENENIQDDPELIYSQSLEREQENGWSKIKKSKNTFKLVRWSR